MEVSLFGLGKAGLPFACIIAKAGHTVYGVDVNADLVGLINKGICPLPQEPGLEPLLKEMVQRKRLIATTDAKMAVSKAAVHIVLVPLFIDAKGKPDYRYLSKALATIGSSLKQNDLVVLETTMPLGATEGIVRKTLERSSGKKAGEGFLLAYSPERTMSGYALSRYRDFPKIVSGLDAKSKDAALSLYTTFSNVRPVSSMRTAEMIKVSEGIYRDVNVALANELLKASEALGVDFWEMRAHANHEFCNIHEAGNGTGGHCIPVYPWFLINAHPSPLTRLGRKINDEMAGYYADKVISQIKARKLPKTATVGILGLTYRAHVKETYNSRAFALIAALRKAKVKMVGHDFLLSPDEVKGAFKIPYSAKFDDMDLIIVLNKNPEYKEFLLPVKDKVIDTKHVLA